ncbi:hypothetical protein CERSUDRAFT_48078, partial [Gelatoporia subvermispora B]
MSPPRSIPPGLRSGYTGFGLQTHNYPYAPRDHEQDEYNSIAQDDLEDEPFRYHVPHRPPTVLPSTHLPSAQRTPIEKGDSRQVERGSAPRNTHGIRLRPVSELPDMYRGLFKFGVFNAVQSSCFDTVTLFHRNRQPMSAPTGSGKTVLFELAIIRMLLEAGSNSRNVKCIYVAPTKSLCSEKFRDWSSKFQPLGVNCVELTGDTLQTGRSAWGSARDANVIVTTGEKWDSLTRNWRSYGQILSQIQLFLVDEVHILTETRGSTLEVIISRMKTRGASVRFIVVSATVPNIDDVARWIGDSNGGPATVMEFGEEFRPCKISKFVYGIPRKQGMNDFVFNRILDAQLYKFIEQHSANQPTLVFCSTRKGVTTTAEQLLKDYEKAAESKQSLPWSRPPRFEESLSNQQVQKLAASGIGVHHAGMTMGDRRTIEDLFLRKILRIVVSTSTLAVGVNLPAHTVIIKGVKTFQNNLSQEYPDLDIIQMIGRAGRPQFDKEGVAVILCETELEAKYKALVKGQSALESCLHFNLAEHVNSEVGLGTITNIDSAKDWLHNSFLFQRIQRNPRHYAIGKDNNQTWQERIDEMVTQSVATLQENQLLEYTDDTSTRLASTEYGEIMSTYYIRHTTMSSILKIPEKASLRDILEIICHAEESVTRPNEDIRFKVKKVENSKDKVFLIVQAVLGAINLADPAYRSGDSQPNLEAPGIFRHIARIAKAVVEVAVAKKSGSMLLHGLEAPLRLEALLNRKPPFGHELLAYVKEFPQYELSITEEEVTPSDGDRPVQVELSIRCAALLSDPGHTKHKKNRYRGSDTTTVLTLTSDHEFIDFRRIRTKALAEPKEFTVSAELVKPSQSVVVYISPDAIAGVLVTATYKPCLDAAKYPSVNTRPKTTLELDMEGLDEDPDFWNMDGDDQDADRLSLEVMMTGSEDAKEKTVSHQSFKGAETRATQVSAFHTAGVPKRLPNGKYECNHTCKDKTKCLHLCCREGIAKPAWSKKRVEAVCASMEAEEEFERTSSMTSTKPKPKPKPCDTRDRHMEHLDALHEGTGVVERLKLNKGQRIKLD